ncbi:MAG: tetratricopeptide repeat protein, partial [Gemmatimonadaceae bacterium]
MYRTDRFSRVEHAERGPFVFAVIAVMVLGVAISCATGHEKTKEENKTPAPPPTLGGEIAQPDHTMQQSGPQTVTFAAAVDAYSKRRYREAAASFEDYTQRHPASASGHYMLGLSAWKSGDLARARLAFERSLELDSTNVKTLLNLGRVLLDQGQPGEALVRIGSAAALDSGSAEVQRMMGRVQTARG